MYQINHRSLQLDGNQMVFLPEFNSIKNIRHSAVEICRTDIIKEATSNWNLYSASLSSFFPSSMIWMLSIGILSKHVQGWSMPGARGGWGNAESGCRAEPLYRSAGTPGESWGTHRTFDSHRLVGGLEKLIPVQCKDIHSPAGFGAVLITVM